MLDMIERLLLEADLEDQLPKLEVGIENKCLILSEVSKTLLHFRK